MSENLADIPVLLKQFKALSKLGCVTEIAIDRKTFGRLLDHTDGLSRGPNGFINGIMQCYGIIVRDRTISEVDRELLELRRFKQEATARLIVLDRLSKSTIKKLSEL